MLIEIGRVSADTKGNNVQFPIEQSGLKFS